MHTIKKCILFAGTVGCSKTPTAVYLSLKLGLPIFSNDAIRVEVLEDLGFHDEDEYLKRRDERLNDLIERGVSFILDASIDRKYELVKEKLEESGYQYFVISFDLSRDFLLNLYEIKKYDWAIENIDKFYEDHENFKKINKDIIGVTIDDNNFKDRLAFAFTAAEEFINK